MTGLTRGDGTEGVVGWRFGFRGNGFFFGGGCHNFRVSGSYFQTVFPFKMRNFVKINFDAFLSKDSFKLDRSSIEIGV